MTRQLNWWITYVVLPLRRGQHFQTVMGPAAPYWPRLSSMRKSGIPVKKSMMKYGMRNTPATQHSLDSRNCIAFKFMLLIFSVGLLTTFIHTNSKYKTGSDGMRKLKQDFKKRESDSKFTCISLTAQQATACARTNHWVTTSNYVICARDSTLLNHRHLSMRFALLQDLYFSQTAHQMSLLKPFYKQYNKYL